MSDGKVIGYLAYVTKIQLICDGDSCITAGSREKMKEYIRRTTPQLLNNVTITKARFGDIKRGLNPGAAYSFDEEAYNRFYPLAKKNGIQVGPEDFSGEPPDGSRSGLHFVQVRKMSISRN